MGFMHPLVGSLANIVLRCHACGRVAQFRSRAVRALLAKPQESWQRNPCKQSLQNPVPPDARPGQVRLSARSALPNRPFRLAGWAVWQGETALACNLLAASGLRRGCLGVRVCALSFTSKSAQASIATSPSACQPPAFALAVLVCRPGALFRVASRGSQRAPWGFKIYIMFVLCT